MNMAIRGGIFNRLLNRHTGAGSQSRQWLPLLWLPEIREHQWHYAGAGGQSGASCAVFPA
jgi:hypothetical protein